MLGREYHEHDGAMRTSVASQLWLVPGVPHIATFEHPVWRTRLVAFLKRALAGADSETTARSGTSPDGSVILQVGYAGPTAAAASVPPTQGPMPGPLPRAGRD